MNDKAKINIMLESLEDAVGGIKLSRAPFEPVKSIIDNNLASIKKSLYAIDYKSTIIKLNNTISYSNEVLSTPLLKKDMQIEGKLLFKQYVNLCEVILTYLSGAQTK